MPDCGRGNQKAGAGEEMTTARYITIAFTGSPRSDCSRPLTLGKPASSQSLIMAMKSVALAATNSGRNALMTEFSSKALWETCTSLQSKYAVRI